MTTHTADICWHDDLPNLRHRVVCLRERRSIPWGRCRSGARWHWTALDLRDDKRLHGTCDTEPEAIDAARAAVVELARDRPAMSAPWHALARQNLRRLNTERRAAKPPATTDGIDPVGYLYGVSPAFDDNPRRIVSYRVQRTTAKRIYYLDHHGHLRYVDRGFLEENGWVNRCSANWWDADRVLHLHPPDLQPQEVGPTRDEVRALRVAMADAHPDRGGTSEGFLAARRRYRQALTAFEARQARREP